MPRFIRIRIMLRVAAKRSRTRTEFIIRAVRMLARYLQGRAHHV